MLLTALLWTWLTHLLPAVLHHQSARSTTIFEIRVIDTYWSDHRHTTFNTGITGVQIDDDLVKGAFEVSLHAQGAWAGRPPLSLGYGSYWCKVPSREGSSPILMSQKKSNACTVSRVNVDGKDEDWLFLFKDRDSQPSSRD